MSKDNIDFLKKKETQMEECQHLFLKIKEGQSYYGFNSSDCGYDPCVVVCLKCGLTNKYIEMNSVEKKYIFGYRYYSGLIDVNDRVFRKQYGHAWRRGGKSFDDSVFNLISDEVFYVSYPMFLYKLANIIKKGADNTEIFDTMKTLYEIETPIERADLNNISQAQELIDRYKNRKVKVLKNKKVN